MSIKFIILLIASILNAVIGILVIKKNYKNVSNVYYGCLCISTSVWALGMSLIHLSTSIFFLNNIVVRLIYIPAFLIPLFYFLFAYQFSYIKPSYLDKYLKIIILIPVILVILVCVGVLKVESFRFINDSLSEISLFPDYIILIIYYCLYIITSLVILFNKYSQSTGIVRAQLKYIILATLTTLVFSFIVCLFFPLFNNFAYDWLGPIITLINVFIIAYYTFYKSPKEI